MKKLPHVNRDLFLPKVLFFFHYLSTAFVVPFLGLFLRRHGLTDGEIGFLYAVKPFFFMLSMPFWGYIADYSGKHKLILMCLMAIAPLLRLSLLGLHGFWTVSAVVLISDFFGSPIEPILDSTCLDVLPDPMLYGKQRLWGAIGWGWVGAPIAGVVLAGAGGMPAIFFGHAILAAVTIFFVSKSTVKANPPDGGSIWDVAGVVFRDVPTSLFFLASLLIGSGFGVIFAYQFLLLSDLGDTGIIMGLATLFTCLTEVPVFYMSDALIKPLGLIRSLELCIFLATVRLLWYGYMTTASQTLYVEWTHGVTFGLAWSAGTRYCRSLAPEGMGATMQGFYTAWMWGIGMGSGCLLGGYIASTRGLTTVFTVFGYANAACFLLVVVAHAFGKLKEPEHGVGPYASKRAGKGASPRYLEFDKETDVAMAGQDASKSEGATGSRPKDAGCVEVEGGRNGENRLSGDGVKEESSGNVVSARSPPVSDDVPGAGNGEGESEPRRKGRGPDGQLEEVVLR